MQKIYLPIFQKRIYELLKTIDTNLRTDTMTENPFYGAILREYKNERKFTKFLKENLKQGDFKPGELYKAFVGLEEV